MTKKLKLIGWGLTLLYLAVLTYLGWGRWDSLQTMDLNAVGDFLAGAGGPLALLWLILGFYQQGEELQRSTEALKLQADELRNSVAQQQALVDVSLKQFEAQTAALDHERQVQRMSLMPVFDLQTDGDQIDNGEDTLYPFVLHNFGATVNRIEVIYEGGGHRRARFDVGSLGRDVSYRFNIVDSRGKQGQARLEIAYVDGAGQHGRWACELTFHYSRHLQRTSVRIDALPA